MSFNKFTTPKFLHINQKGENRSEDARFFICHMTSSNDFIKNYLGFMGGSLSQ